MEGYADHLKEPAQACADTGVSIASFGSKRADTCAVALAKRKGKGFWWRNGQRKYPDLAKVALRLLAAHSTSASTERNWTLWGRVYTLARTALGLERAKKLIMFCFNVRCRVAKKNDFHTLLSTVENLLSGESSEAAVKAVAGLHEAAADAEGTAAVAAAAVAAAAVARGALEVALGADVALPAATSDAEDHVDDYCG